MSTAQTFPRQPIDQGKAGRSGAGAGSACHYWLCAHRTPVLNWNMCRGSSGAPYTLFASTSFAAKAVIAHAASLPLAGHPLWSGSLSAGLGYKDVPLPIVLVLLRRGRRSGRRRMDLVLFGPLRPPFHSVRPGTKRRKGRQRPSAPNRPHHLSALLVMGSQCPGWRFPRC